MKIDEKVVKLQIWDTAGQEKYRAINKNKGMANCFAASGGL